MNIKSCKTLSGFSLNIRGATHQGKLVLGTLVLCCSTQAFSDLATADSTPVSPVPTEKKQENTSKSLLQRLLDSYEESSKTDETLKYLLDAKMYLSTAEHDLLVSQDKESAQTDIQNSLSYLQQAEKIAKPEIKDKIAKLHSAMQKLKDKTTNKKELGLDNDVARLLNTSETNLGKAKEQASAPVKIQIEALILRIRQLRQQIEHENLRADYESAMKTLADIIKSLN